MIISCKNSESKKVRKLVKALYSICFVWTIRTPVDERHHDRGKGSCAGVQVSALTDDVTDLGEDVNLVEAEQLIQDEKILELQIDAEG